MFKLCAQKVNKPDQKEAKGLENFSTKFNKIIQKANYGEQLAWFPQFIQNFLTTKSTTSSGHRHLLNKSFTHYPQPLLIRLLNIYN